MIIPECINKIINNLYTLSFNNAVNKSVFSDQLKHADIKPIYKKQSTNEKKNHRPVSIFPNLSKIFEHCMYDQFRYCYRKIIEKLWNLVRNEYKTIELLADFMAKIKTCVPENCPSSLSKTYIHQIDFI